MHSSFPRICQCWASRAEGHAKNCLLNAKSKVFAVRFVSCCARQKRSSAKVSEWPFQTSAHWPNQIHECLFVLFYCNDSTPFFFRTGKNQTRSPMPICSNGSTFLTITGFAILDGFKTLKGNSAYCFQSRHQRSVCKIRTVFTAQPHRIKIFVWLILSWKQTRLCCLVGLFFNVLKPGKNTLMEWAVDYAVLIIVITSISWKHKIRLKSHPNPAVRCVFGE